MSYHNLKIQKHSHTSSFKLLEEAYEYLDAISTDNRVMAVQELSDLYGVLKQEIGKYGMTTKDLEIMSNLTEQVFVSGHRTSIGLFDYLKENYTSIHNFGLGFIQVKVGKSLSYNFYSNKIEKFKNREAPHTHKNAFISEILYGELFERLYDLQSSKQTQNIRCCREDKESVCGSLSLIEEIVHKQGDYYQREAITPHSVFFKESCITKVFKLLDYDYESVIYDDEKYELPEIQEQEMWGIVGEEIINAKL